jgi:hypothetical protein
VLTGQNDWAQTTPAAGVFRDSLLGLGFQCNTGFYADGAPPPDQVEDREITVTAIVAQNKLYPFLHSGIDIRPGCATNWIALSGPGIVDVAAYATADFDPTQVVQSDLKFAGATAQSVQLKDVNNDGVPDLYATFKMTDLNLNAASTTASLNGELQSSQAFGDTDYINLVPYPGPVVTLHNDGSGYSRTLGPQGPHYASFTLADCADSVIDRCNNVLQANQAGTIVRITSDEPDQHTAGNGSQPGTGNGRKVDDMAITGPSSFVLERAMNGGRGDGRVYTVTFDVKDSYGNTSEWQCKIQMPRTPNSTAIDSGPQECVGTCP